MQRCGVVAARRMHQKKNYSSLKSSGIYYRLERTLPSTVRAWLMAAASSNSMGHGKIPMATTNHHQVIIYEPPSMEPSAFRAASEEGARAQRAKNPETRDTSARN